MVQESLRQQETLLLEKLVGEWVVGVALKTPKGKVLTGCGEMSVVEMDSGVNSEINTNIDGYEEYYENHFWSYDPVSGQVHLFSVTSEGQTHDHTGKWVDDSILELHWRGTYEDQDQEEHIAMRWVSKNHFELTQTNYSQGKPLLTTDYIFKRRET
jgi:hypothetical protein